MAREDEKTTPTTRGILSTIAAGFDMVTNHLWLVALPVILDVTYWIGPQVRASALWLALADLFREAQTMLGMADQIAQLAGHTNLSTFLSVPFLGVPGLMAGLIMPEKTPIEPVIWEVANPLAWLFLFVAFSIAGVVVSAVFHAFIARAVCQTDSMGCWPVSGMDDAPWRSLLRRLPLYCLRVLVMALVLFLLALMIYMPVALVAAFVTLFSVTLGSMIMLGALVILLWMFFYLSFGLHGILLRDRSVSRALLDSLRFVQRNWFAAFSLFLLIVGLRNLLSWLWLQVDTGSWLTLISIAGFAFVNTSLIAATFIFYRERIDFQRQGFVHE